MFNEHPVNSSKDRRRQFIKIVAGLCSIPLLVAGVIYLFPPLTEVQIEERIATSGTLTTLNQLCTDVRKPEDFQFIAKSLQGSTRQAVIRFDFSSKLKLSDVQGFYSKWAVEEGWETRSSKVAADGLRCKFTKGNLDLEIISVENKGSDYAIYCRERID